MMTMITAEPPAPPVSLVEIKAFLRIGTSEEDALLAGAMRSAADMCEAFTGRALIARSIAETLPASPAWTRLGAAPVRAIESVAALSENGIATALAAEDYAVDIDAAGDGWVRLLGVPAGGRILVSYLAGLAADPNGVPEALRHGIVRLTAHLYTHREAEGGAGPPAAVTALWRPWRRLRMG